MPGKFLPLVLVGATFAVAKTLVAADEKLVPPFGGRRHLKHTHIRAGEALTISTGKLTTLPAYDLTAK